MTSPCTGLEETHVVLLGQCLSLFCFNNFFVKQITFISYQDFLNVGISMHFNLSDPIPNIVEALLRCAIVCQYYTHCSLVIGLCDGSKPFLSSSIPYLQFDISAIDIYGFYLEINTYTFLITIIHLPIVEMCEFAKLSSENRSKKQVFPTPESPIRINFIRQSKAPLLPLIFIYFEILYILID